MDNVKVLQVGGSMAVILPSEVVQKFSIEKGTCMRVGITLVNGEYVVYYAVDNNGNGNSNKG